MENLTEVEIWKWKLKKLTEIEIRNRSWKVLVENEIQQKLKMFALKFYSESKLKLESEAENGKWYWLLCVLKLEQNQVVTAVWRNSWFCLSWKILWIFQFSFSKIFCLNCRWFAKRRNVNPHFSREFFYWNLAKYWGFGFLKTFENVSSESYQKFRTCKIYPK